MKIVDVMRRMPNFIKEPYFERLRQRRLASPVIGKVQWYELTITSARNMGLFGDAAEAAANEAANRAKTMQSAGVPFGTILDVIQSTLANHKTGTAGQLSGSKLP